MKLRSNENSNEMKKIFYLKNDTSKVHEVLPVLLHKFTTPGFKEYTFRFEELLVLRLTWRTKSTSSK